MGKTLIICDSTCDVSVPLEQKYGIKVVNCSVEMNGLPYIDRLEISSNQIYRFVEENSGSMPSTAQVTVIQFLEEFLKAAKEGYTNIICITMNSKGSGTNSAAIHAANLFPQEYPSLEGKLDIRVIDSTTYSLPILLPILPALERLKNGENPNKVADDLEDWYQNSVTLVGLYNLQYAKKSGRLNACAAFVGDMLGLKPIMSINGENHVVEKVRGEKNLIPKLVELYQQTAEDIKGDYAIAYGDNPEQAKELASAIRKIGGKAPIVIGPIGPCVAINAGPKMLGLGFRTK